MDIRQLTNLAYTSPETGFPDRVKETIDDAVYSSFSKIWRGMLKVAASGFGKGVLLTAAIVVGGAAVAWGLVAGAGALISATGVAATADSGLMLGAAKGLNFLFSGMGVAALGIGGALGAVADVKKHQNNITEEVAKMQAKQFEKARSGHLSVSTDKQLGVPETETSYTGRKKPTNGKGAQSLASASMLRDEQSCGTFCQQEEERRAEREIVGRSF